MSTTTAMVYDPQDGINAATHNQAGTLHQTDTRCTNERTNESINQQTLLQHPTTDSTVTMRTTVTPKTTTDDRQDDNNQQCDNKPSVTNTLTATTTMAAAMEITPVTTTNTGTTNVATTNVATTNQQSLSTLPQQQQ